MAAHHQDQELLDVLYAEHAGPLLDDAQRLLERALLVWDVAAAFRTLSAEHRTILLEVHYRDRSIAQVALALGIPEGTVKSRTFYALRLALEERGVGPA